MTRERLITSLAAYSLIALLATFTLEGRFRQAIWVLMAGLALKTLISSEQLRAQHTTETAQRSGADKVDPHEQQQDQPK